MFLCLIREEIDLLWKKRKEFGKIVYIYMCVSNNGRIIFNYLKLSVEYIILLI